MEHHLYLDSIKILSENIANVQHRYIMDSIKQNKNNKQHSPHHKKKPLCHCLQQIEWDKHTHAPNPTPAPNHPRYDDCLKFMNQLISKHKIPIPITHFIRYPTQHHQPHKPKHSQLFQCINKIDWAAHKHMVLPPKTQPKSTPTTQTQPKTHHQYPYQHQDKHSFTPIFQRAVYSFQFQFKFKFPFLHPLLSHQHIKIPKIKWLTELTLGFKQYAHLIHRQPETPTTTTATTEIPEITEIIIENKTENTETIHTITQLQQKNHELQELMSQYEHELTLKDQELQNLKHQIQQLQSAYQIQEYAQKHKKHTPHHRPALLHYGTENDLYDNEVLSFIIKTLEYAYHNHTYPNSRYQHILHDLLQANPITKDHRADKQKALQQTMKTYSRMDSPTRQALMKIGFHISEDGSHYKMVFMNDSRYTCSTSKTSSDIRTGKNFVCDVSNLLF